MFLILRIARLILADSTEPLAISNRSSFCFARREGVPPFQPAEHQSRAILRDPPGDLKCLLMVAGLRSALEGLNIDDESLCPLSTRAPPISPDRKNPTKAGVSRILAESPFSFRSTNRNPARALNYSGLKTATPQRSAYNRRVIWLVFPNLL